MVIILIMFNGTFICNFNTKAVEIIGLEKIKRFFVFFLISILGFAYKNIKRIENNYNTNNLWPVVARNNFENKVSDESYFYFSNGKQCMYKSPCTYYIQNILNIKKFFHTIFIGMGLNYFYAIFYNAINKTKASLIVIFFPQVRTAF